MARGVAGPVFIDPLAPGKIGARTAAMMDGVAVLPNDGVETLVMGEMIVMHEHVAHHSHKR